MSDDDYDDYFNFIIYKRGGITLRAEDIAVLPEREIEILLKNLNYLIKLAEQACEDAKQHLTYKETDIIDTQNKIIEQTYIAEEKKYLLYILNLKLTEKTTNLTDALDKLNSAKAAYKSAKKNHSRVDKAQSLAYGAWLDVDKAIRDIERVEEERKIAMSEITYNIHYNGVYKRTIINRRNEVQQTENDIALAIKRLHAVPPPYSADPPPEYPSNTPLPPTHDRTPADG